MIKAECDNCGKDKVDDYIYCRNCYESLEEKLKNEEDYTSDLENELGSAKDEIASLNARIEDLNKEIELKNQENNEK